MDKIPKTRERIWKRKESRLDDVRDTCQFMKTGLCLSCSRADALAELEMVFRSDRKENGLAVRVMKRAGVKGH